MQNTKSLGAPRSPYSMTLKGRSVSQSASRSVGQPASQSVGRASSHALCHSDCLSFCHSHCLSLRHSRNQSLWWTVCRCSSCNTRKPAGAFQGTRLLVALSWLFLVALCLSAPRSDAVSESYCVCASLWVAVNSVSLCLALYSV